MINRDMSIDVIKRLISNISVTEQIIVMGDDNAQAINFTMSDEFEIDVLTKNIFIKFINAANYGDKTAVTDITRTTNTDGPDTITFNWIIPEIATAVAGTMYFALEIINEDYKWSTKSTMLFVEKTVDLGTIITIPDPLWLEAYEARLLEIETTTEGYKNIAVTSTENALSYKNLAETGATTATTKAEEAAASAGGIVTTEAERTSAEIIRKDNEDIRIENEASREKTNITLENTTHVDAHGIIYKDGIPFFHNFNYGDNGAVITNGRNLFLGENAGNLTMGENATSAIEASYNAFIGYKAGFSNTTGHKNAFIGTYAGYCNTSGYNNVALSYYAGQSNTEGYNNSFIGSSAGYYNTTGHDNTYIGYNAGRYNEAGDDNIFIGSDAGRKLNDDTNNNNLANKSLFLGGNAKAQANDQTNQIVIGFEAEGAGDNSVVIGNDDVELTKLKGAVQLQPVTPLNTPVLGAMEFVDDGTNGNIYTTMNVGGVLTIVPNLTVTEKTKLSGIETNANKYVLPSDVVQDSTYVKTDKNFTTAKDNKLTSLENYDDTEVKDLIANKTHPSLRELNSDPLNQHVTETQISGWDDKSHTSLTNLNDDSDNTHTTQALKDLLNAYGVQTLRPSVFEIKCNAGRFDCSWNSPIGRAWQFPEGTVLHSDGVTPVKVSYADSSDVDILDNNSVVKLSCATWNGAYSFSDNSTGINILIDLADLPPLSYYLSLYNCALVTGDLADLPPLRYYLILYNCALVTGDLADLPPLSIYLSLSNCALVTGAYTSISGTNVPTHTLLEYTGLSASDVDSTLIAYANCTKDNGNFYGDGMTRTAASDTAVATLTGRGWTITGITKV